MKFEYLSKLTIDCIAAGKNKLIPKEIYSDIQLIVEFKENLISQPTKEGKEGVILHYLNEIDNCVYAIYDFLPKYNEVDDSTDFNFSGNTIVHSLLKLYESIQEYSTFLGIDFDKIVSTIGFDTSILPMTYFELLRNENLDSDSLEIEVQQDNEKIYLLYKLGVIDILRKNYGGLSNLKIGEILFPVTGIKANTTAQFLGRFDSENINPKVISKIESIINRLKLN